MEERVEITDFKKEARRRKIEEAKMKAKGAALGVWGWAKDHPMESLGIVTAGLGVTKKTLGIRKVKTEERRRETEFYNPRTGMYSKIKRPLTAKEKSYAEKRFRNGDSWNDIFSDMKILK